MKINISGGRQFPARNNKIKKKGKSVNTLMEGGVTNQSRSLTMVSEGLGDTKEDPGSSSSGDKRCGRRRMRRSGSATVMRGGEA